MAVNKQ